MEKRLKFTFYDNDELLIDKIVEYRLLDNYYIFDYEKETFKFRLEDDIFHFIKESQIDAFEIFQNGSMQECVYTLKSEKMSFDIKILTFEYKKEDKKYIIKYNIESDIEDDVSRTKTIILDFIHESS